MDRLPEQFKELVWMALESDDWEFRRAAINAYTNYTIPNSIFEKIRKDVDLRVRLSAVQAFEGRAVPMNWIEDALEDNAPIVRATAVKIMNNMPVDLHVIKIAIDDECWIVRQAAVYLCSSQKLKFNKRIPKEWIIQLLYDRDDNVRDLTAGLLVE